MERSKSNGLVNNVLMIVWNFKPGPQGGAERQCWTQALALTQRDYSVTIATRWPYITTRMNEVDEGVRIRRLGILSPLYGLLQLAKKKVKAKMVVRSDSKVKYISHKAGIEVTSQQNYVMVIARKIEFIGFMIELSLYILKNKNNIDIIHVHGGYWIAGYSYWIGSKLNIPSLAKIGTYPAIRPIRKIVPFADLWESNRLLNNFFVLQDDAKNELLAAQVPADSIYVIPNAVLIPQQKAHLRKKNVLLIANYSQGAFQKGFDILLEAWKIVQNNEPMAHLYIVGDGDHSRWNRFAQENALCDSVHFEGFTEDVGSFYKDARIFVLPSRVEGMSNALLEAQSWGVPAVVSDIPGNKAVVQSGVNGIIVPVGDVTILAEKIIELLGDEYPIEEMGKCSRERISKEFSVDSVAYRIEGAYKRIATKSSGAR